VFFEIEIGRRETLAFLRRFDEMWQRAIGIGTNDERDAAVSLEQPRTESLGHAAGDAEDGILAHETTNLTEAANDALLGVIANGARIQENHVGAFGTVDARIAFSGQLAEHELGVADVHLAAVGFDIDFGHF
jgi:hypothetical protein